MIEDIKGYKPHTNKKIETVNRIKSLEVELGALFTEIETELSDQYSKAYNEDVKVLDDLMDRVHQVSTAKERLKEASMWACRAVFQPVESY
ncbi:Hypothetical protein KNT65_gp131 [Escherichia phage EcS1]|uniref:Acb2/Tad1 hairpin domain-containing protein n=1 Tax=Escherichia phage EcS1 TaxID=2083276 RepID=A0A2Z5ZC32_9CAUD|nr:Hypothetical protein KNT65_gp131 [Escherichia phage EcS1]BBC78179.1 Hypothetical protein [Escherichia phage EcS1]